MQQMAGAPDHPGLSRLDLVFGELKEYLALQCTSRLSVYDTCCIVF